MKNILIACMVLLVTATYGNACVGLISYSVDANKNTSLQLNSGSQTITFAGLGSGSNTTKAGRLQTALQNVFDVRQTLLSLPTDDPDKIVNPNKPYLFWSDSFGTPDGNIVTATHLTGRSCLAKVTWNGTTFVVEFTKTL